jgi:acyl carrier protein
MTRAEIEAAVVAALSEVAPEVEPGALKADAPLRDQVDLDSFDYLNFIIALHKSLGVEVPESDYPRLATLAGAVDYLEQRVG